MTDGNLVRPLTAFPVQVARAAPDPRLTSLLARLAAASTTAEIADAAVAQAVVLLGGRAGALGLLSPGSSRVEIAGSVGYGCGMMSAGSSLDAGADLPITRAATTGRTVVEAGGWIAAPLASAPSPLGALLVSLARPTETPAADAALLEEIAAHTRAALARLPRRPPPPDVVAWSAELDGVAAAVRSQPVSHASGGDIVEFWSAGDGSCWLLVADACGADAPAAATALAVSVAARALAATSAGPAALLTGLDAALGATARADRFVTAVAARLRRTDGGVSVTLASAGHPAPCVVTATTASYVDLPAEPPLNLRLGAPVHPRECTLLLAPGDRLVVFTDGALDRTGGTLPDDVLLRAVSALGRDGDDALPAGDGATGLGAVSAALEAAGGPSRDDMAIAVVALGAS